MDDGWGPLFWIILVVMVVIWVAGIVVIGHFVVKFW